MKTASPTTPGLHAADTTASAAASAAREINRLHTEAQRLAAESRHSLDGALAAAWHAGRLLIAEKKRIRSAGHGAWLPWLEHFFEGTTRTAQRYMRLARIISDPAFLKGLSLRQSYARLGIATEPKRPAGRMPLPKPPEHVLLASKLVRFLRQAAASENQQNYVRDLAALYRQLHALYSRYPVNSSSFPENSKHLPDDFL